MYTTQTTSMVGPEAAKPQCAVTRCRPTVPLGDKANANCVRLCICVNLNTCDIYNFTVFLIIPNSYVI